MNILKTIAAEKILVFFGIISFPILFYKADLGLNWVLYQIPFILYYIYKLQFKPLLLTLWLFSLAGILFYANPTNYILNIIVLISVIGSFNFKFTPLNSWTTSILKVYQFFIFNPDKSYLKFSPIPLQRVSYLSKTLLIPSIIFILFLILYSSGINGLNILFLEPIKNFLMDLFINFDLLWFIYPILGGFFVFLFLFEPRLNYVKHWFGESLERKKTFSNHPFTFIKSTQITFIGLDLILIMAIISQYFDFYQLLSKENSYEEVKSTVHQSTYFLLAALLIGIVLVSAFYNGQILFFNKKEKVTRPTKIWIGLNGLLALNLLFINSYYIYNYNLAYKRIGIILFIIILIFTLVKLIELINYRKTISYLANKSLKFSLILCLFASLFNWDYIITKWNLSRSEAYLDMNFLVTRNYSSLKILLERPDLIDKPINPYDINYWAEIKSKGQEIITYRNYINYRIAKMDNSNWKSFSIFPK